MKVDAEFIPGLEGVIAAETAISLLATEKEKIVVKGYDLIELSKDKDYLDIVHLLLADQLPNQDEKIRVEERLQD
ncbi:MAG TPA: citrate/2-methylcitrate synthase, partial [Bacillota bacterium]|nr:citrate/2-methylcitrate synthase [Bacillota bacterium]